MTSFACSIRFATFADAATIADFNRRLAAETENRELDSKTVTAGVESLLQQDGSGFYLVAVSDRRVIGCLMITYEWSDWRNGLFWWIQSVYVLAEFRRRGVFRELYLHAEEMARQLPGVCGLRLYVEHENEIARNTYSRLGMSQTPYQIYEKEFAEHERGA
ncbi:MAG: GNAT family N-acetyltransferase [Planctomycetales bacterium]|nr:GNAT family N-acetyltransferase [Planctomycetales bacterium]